LYVLLDFDAGFDGFDGFDGGFDMILEGYSTFNVS